MSNPVKVTVTMPAYNAQEFIAQAIESALSQKYNYFELLIIDDGSIDNTPGVVAKYKNDSRLKYYRQPHKGLTPTRNRLIDLAKGKYICPLDTDDTLLPGKIKIQAEFLDSHPHIGVIYGKAKIINSRGKSIMESGIKEIGKDIKESWDLIDFPVPHCTSLIRKKKIMDVGKYDINMKYAPDTDIMLKLAEVTEFHFINRYVYLYRRHPKNMTRDYKATNDESALVRKNAIRRRYCIEGQLKFNW